MAIETIIRHDPSQIGVANKKHTEKVIHLSFVPIRSIVQTGDTWDWRGFICVCLDTNTRVVTNAEQVVDDFKSLVFGGEINSSNIGDLCEFCRSVVCGNVSGIEPVDRASIQSPYISGN
jgi:hypothetical protein